MDEAQHLVTLWTQVVEVEMKADYLEVKLSHDMESHQGIGAIEKKASKSKHEPLVARKVHGSSRVVDEARLQGTTSSSKCVSSSCRVDFPK